MRTRRRRRCRSARGSWPGRETSSLAPTKTGAGWRRPPLDTQKGPGALLGGSRQRLDRHMHPILGPALELNLAVDQREDGVIAPEADILSRLPLGATLAEDDVARNNHLAAVLLDAEPPAFGVAAVARGAACLFVCHLVLLLRRGPRIAVRGGPRVGAPGKIFRVLAGGNRGRMRHVQGGRFYRSRWLGRPSLGGLGQLLAIQPD